MACSFCATGQAGFERHMTVGEIVEQVVIAARVAKPRRLSNVVFLGMGEPLANYDATWGAVERIHGALGLSARHITVSTVGLVPGIERITPEAQARKSVVEGKGMAVRVDSGGRRRLKKKSTNNCKNSERQ